jgi:hypothetical protein
LDAAPATLIQAFERQVAWCRERSPFTARLLARSAAWLARDAGAHAALAAISPDPLAAAVALRWAAALHHLALKGLSPWKELWRPAMADARTFDVALDVALDAALDAAIAQAWREQRAHLDRALALPPQTNEVQRSVALLPGLLHVAARTGLPLRLLEIGASAGINLWCDRWRYEFGAWDWGDSASPLVLHCGWQGPPPAEAGADLRVAYRAACDRQPIDLQRPDDSLRLVSFIWPDQALRLARLLAARDAAARWMAREGVAVEALSALSFVQRELGTATPGLATVLMHSVVWQYIAAEERAAIAATVEAAGRRATADAPLAWLRLEPAVIDGSVELRCRIWPDAAPGPAPDRLLARGHAHVADLQWLDSPADGSAA